MAEQVRRDETLVISRLQDSTHALVRIAEPQLPVALLTGTLLAVEHLSPVEKFFLPNSEQPETWVYSRFVRTGQSETGRRLEALDFGLRVVALKDFPLGMAVRVAFVPRDAQQAFQTLIWPPWTMPIRKLRYAADLRKGVAAPAFGSTRVN